MARASRARALPRRFIALANITQAKASPQVLAPAPAPLTPPLTAFVSKNECWTEEGHGGGRAAGKAQPAPARASSSLSSRSNAFLGPASARPLRISRKEQSSCGVVNPVAATTPPLSLVFRPPSSGEAAGELAVSGVFSYLGHVTFCTLDATTFARSRSSSSTTSSSANSSASNSASSSSENPGPNRGVATGSAAGPAAGDAAAAGPGIQAQAPRSAGDHPQGQEQKQQHRTPEEHLSGGDPAPAVLAASLPFVLESGWTEAAMLEGARAAGLSPAILSIFPRREAHLVEYFMDECRRKMEVEAQERATEILGLDDLGERLQLVVRMRLEQQALYSSTWAQALSIQALPGNMPRTVEQRLQLVASLWAAAGERTRSDLEARALCTMLGAVYTASELFMLTDFSPGFEDTWQFAQRRLCEGLQAFSGMTAAQEQVQRAALGALKQLGLSLPPFPWTSASTTPPAPASAPNPAHSPSRPPAGKGPHGPGEGGGGGAGAADPGTPSPNAPGSTPPPAPAQPQRS